MAPRRIQPPNPALAPAGDANHRKAFLTTEGLRQALRPQPKTRCPQISPIGADFQRKGKEQEEETTDRRGSPSSFLLLESVLLTRNNGKRFPDCSDRLMQALVEEGIISRAETQGRWDREDHSCVVLCVSASPRELIWFRREAGLGNLRILPFIQVWTFAACLVRKLARETRCCVFAVRRTRSKRNRRGTRMDADKLFW